MSGPSQVRGPQQPALLQETIGDCLRRIATLHAEREALVSCHQDVRLTYGELDAEVDRLAGALLTAGLEPGDRVGIWSPNCVEWTLIQLATARAGIILVNVNPAYRTSELVYALNQSGCRMLLAARAFKTSDYAAMVDEVRRELRTLEEVVFLGEASWDALLAGGRDDVAWPDLAPTDPINIQYTSGTTGMPKGATLSHRNILNNGYFVGEGCRYTEADRICIPVPFYHCFGMVMGTLAAITHGARRVCERMHMSDVAICSAWCRWSPARTRTPRPSATTAARGSPATRSPGASGSSTSSR